jgi:tRNA threonylcarbamoyladenosine biosynthesis protein TsaE
VHERICPSPEDLRALGRALGEVAGPGAVFLLEGDLGAGKTTLAQGIALGLGVVGAVTSPTYALVHVYQGRLPFWHLDLYRLEGPVDLDELGLDSAPEEAVLAIEWPDRASRLPARATRVSLFEHPLGRRVCWSAPPSAP